MNAIPPTTTPGSSPGMAFGHWAADAWSRRWIALHETARTVATLAGIAPDPFSSEIGEFPALIRKGASWRRDLAERGIEDIAARLEPGAAALLGVHARGADPRPAAQALWREFVEARSAVLALLSPGIAQGPLFST